MMQCERKLSRSPKMKNLSVLLRESNTQDIVDDLSGMSGMRAFAAK